MATVSRISAALLVALVAAPSALAETDEFDSDIVVGCHFAAGEWGVAGVNMCIEANRAARREVEAYPAEYEEIRARCIRRREAGWSVVKECVEDEIAADAALKNYDSRYQPLIEACTREHRRRGTARIKICVDEVIAAQAGCPQDDVVAAHVADFMAARVSQGLGRDLSLADSRCGRWKLVQAFSRVIGPAVGYKAAFTNPALQKRFGVKSPEWGAMFGNMMVQSGARLPTKFGARPLFEADFAVVVKAPGLADVFTPIEALDYLSEVVPFIELPDLMLDGSPTGQELIATNVGFRGGVLGKGVKVEATEEFLEMLRGMTVVMTEDVSGKELGRAPGKAIMNQPINAAIWIAKALRADGIELKAGDILSLGGYIPPLPPQPGTRITVRYVGLPGDPSVSVQFE